jgi:5-methylcytosine-specific restriction endonuclease McrA
MLRARRSHLLRVLVVSVSLCCGTPAISGGADVSRAGGKLGPSVTLGPVLKRAHCHVRGPLPDAGCTPGARFSKVSRARVCRAGYSENVRNVSDSTKDAVYAAYGMAKHFDGSNGEVDHLVSLELGGSNSRANLFPEAARPRPGSHEKDRLENRLHEEMCAGTITMSRAQRLIASDWVAAYHARFG